MAAMLISNPPHHSNIAVHHLKKPFNIPSSCQLSIHSTCSNGHKVVRYSSPQMPRTTAHLGVGTTSMDEYASQAELLQEFTRMPTVDKAWVFQSKTGNTSKAMFSISQLDLLENRRRTLILSSYISKKNKDSLNIEWEWSPFPIEMLSASAIVPSPSGSKLLVVRNKDKAPTLEIWGPSKLEKEITIPQSVHGSIYADRWFEGISWHPDENLIAYIAEEPPKRKPTFDGLGFKKESSFEKDPVCWKGQGEWEEDWGETYTEKRKPSLFVVNISREEVRPVEGIAETLSVGQVVWAPSSSNVCDRYLVFVGWSDEIGPQKVRRKLGMKVCYNRPCALYSVKSPFTELGAEKLQLKVDETQDSSLVVHLTPSFSSAFFPRFSPDGKFLVFMSAESAVDTGAHSVTKSLHRMIWPAHGKPCPINDIVDVVSIVMCSEDGFFPGLYCANLLYNPWLSDGHTLILSSAWGSTQVILGINILSSRISRISSADSSFSWNVLALDGDNILAVSSSPIDPPQIKYGSHIPINNQEVSWVWQDVSIPMIGHSKKVRSLLSSTKFSILKIPINNSSETLSRGAKKPFESIFISVNESQIEEESLKDHGRHCGCNPLIVLIHGGPHSVSLTNYSKSAAFMSSLGYNLLIVNYRGSVGFGEEALQSLPGKIGCQDVNDILTAVDYLIAKGLADASKVAAYGSSHGGFLTAHLIGQAIDRFAVAAVRNPVCNLSLMAATSDIPDWCYALALGNGGNMIFSEAVSPEHESLFYKMSPISHMSKVKTPTLFLLGAVDRRVPPSNGLQYARALKEKGVDVKIMVFPGEGHVNFRPQSEFESLLNIAVWFKKYFN